MPSLECPKCGNKVNGDTKKEILGRMHQHAHDHHPEILKDKSRDDIQMMKKQWAKNIGR